MIRHIVMFKLRKFDSVEEKLASAQKIRANFLDLKNFINEIISYEVGINIVNSPKSFDIVINSEFKNLEDLKKYQEHPAHLSAVALNSEFSVNKVVVDYNCE